MLLRRWLLSLAVTVPLHAQAPESLSPGDARLVWPRPDLQAELFDAAAVKMDAAAREALVAQLLLLVRNLPDGPTLATELRSQALGLALRLDRGHPQALIANGQLARGLRPQPLPADVPPTTESIAAYLIKTAQTLLHAQENSAHRLAYLLLDIARRLDPARAPEIARFTYGTTVQWPGPAAAEPPLWAAPELSIMTGSVRFLTSIDKGRPVIFTVSAQAGQGNASQKLQAVLPEDLLAHMKDGKQKALRDEVEARSLAMRDMLHLRHDQWPEGWRVQFTFSTDTRRGLLPQAFAGMGVVLDSMLCGEALDPRVLVAGGIDTAGKFWGALPADDAVNTVAQTEPGAVLVLPGLATGEIEDWLLARPSQWNVLTQLTVMRASSLADVMAIAYVERAGKLAQSFAAFEQVAAQLRAADDPLTLLRTPEVVATLQSITALHPQHVNADILQRIATQTMPKHASLRGSLRMLTLAAAPLLSGDRKRYPLNLVLKVTEPSVFSTAGAELASMRPRLHPGCRPYLKDLLALANVLHQACGKHTREEPATARAVRERALQTMRALEAEGR